jgi:predicted ATPase
MTITEQTFTAAERAEWHALMDRASALSKQRDEADREAGAWIRWAVQNGGDMDLALTKAQEFAAQSIELWAERERVSDEAAASPFGQKVRRDLEARFGA